MSTKRTILAGDIGGTKTLLLLAELGPSGQSPLYERRFDSGAFQDLGAMVREFLDSAPGGAWPDRACFGVAGPVDGGCAKLTNLPWKLDEEHLSSVLGVPTRLMNDFVAIGFGVEALKSEDLAVLQAGELLAGAPRVILGAGTGLGVCFAMQHGGRYEVVPSEGGHADFAPRNEFQMGLLRYLQTSLGRVSWERVLSGAGLVQIHRYLTGSGQASISSDLAKTMAEGDAAAAISAFALSGRDPGASRALDVFVEAYGAQAGNLALTFLARGGVYVAGGIASKIMDRMIQGPFLDAFRDKGRYRAFMEKIPVYVVQNPKVGLLGAALAAQRSLDA